VADMTLDLLDSFQYVQQPFAVASHSAAPAATKGLSLRGALFATKQSLSRPGDCGNEGLLRKNRSQ